MKLTVKMKIRVINKLKKAIIIIMITIRITAILEKERRNGIRSTTLLKDTSWGLLKDKEKREEETEKRRRSREKKKKKKKKRSRKKEKKKRTRSKEK